MSNRIITAFVAACAVICMLSCSGGMSPVAGDITNSQQERLASSNSHLWGYYRVAIDTVSGIVDIIPVRRADFAANVTVFLQPPLGNSGNLQISIPSIGDFQTTGILDVDVTLIHPFAGLDQYTGFDVAGALIGHGDTYGSHDPGVFYAKSPDNVRLLNPDGYTRWYNPTEFTSPNLLGFVEGALGTKGQNFSGTINGYKYFCDGLQPEDDLSLFLQDEGNLSNRGKFEPGSNSRRYRIQFPMQSGSPVVEFQYAVIANWEQPDVNPPTSIPGDFPINANKAEPFHLSVLDTGSDAWYDPDTGSGGGSLNLRAELWDWQSPYNPSGVLGEISAIMLESDDFIIPPEYEALTPEFLSPFTIPGTSVSSVASLEIDVEPLKFGKATLLITVESNDPNSYDQGFGVPVPDAALASYFFATFDIPVSNPCIPPVVALSAPSTGSAGADIEFDASGTSGTDPITYEWDWEGDGIYDESGTDPIVTHQFSPGDWEVGLKVSNDCGDDILSPMHAIIIDCPSEVHSTVLGTISCTGNFTNIRQDATAFLPDGRLLLKSGANIVAYEVDTPGTVLGEIIVSSMANGYAQWCYLANLDYDEVNERLIYSTVPNTVERITVYEDDGTYLTEFDLPNSGGVIAGIDTDGNGGIWALYHTPGGSTGTNTLYHYEWNGTSGTYDYVSADTLDCTFVVGGARGLYDIAVIPSVERLYILHNENYPYQGAIYTVDIGVSPPVRIDALTVTHIFDESNDHAASISDFNKWEGGTLEVDHGNGSAESCRLVATLSFQSNGNGIGIKKFDADLNEMDYYRVAGTRYHNGSFRPGTEANDPLFALVGWDVGSANLVVYEAPSDW
ncbi:MAG TPA: PKD domain-containing protein [bacterium]